LQKIITWEGKILHRDEALVELKKHINNKNLFKHMLAVEAVMRRLARHFDQDEELWGLAGLLHDIDYAETAKEPARHSLVGGAMLAELNLPEALIHAWKPCKALPKSLACNLLIYYERSKKRL
jgi:putative nucleotidyltransferase with HDIG domain